MGKKSWSSILLFIVVSYSIVYLVKMPFLKKIEKRVVDRSQQRVTDREMVERSKVDCESYFTEENAISVIQSSWKRGDLKDVLLRNREELDIYATKLPNNCSFSVVVKESGANEQVAFEVIFAGNKKAIINSEVPTNSFRSIYGTWE